MEKTSVGPTLVLGTWGGSNFEGVSRHLAVGTIGSTVRITTCGLWIRVTRRNVEAPAPRRRRRGPAADWGTGRVRRVADAAAYVEVERGVGVVVWLGDARIAGASRVRGHRFTAPRRRSWGQGPGRVAGLPACALHATGDGRRLSAPCHASESEPC